MPDHPRRLRPGLQRQHRRLLDRSGSAVAYSTFLGGTSFDSGHEIAVDRTGSSHVTGFTGSLNYPTTTGAYDPSHNGGGEAYVTKLDTSGTGLAYSTYLGGAGSDVGNAIAVDEQDKAGHVTGSTDSADYRPPSERMTAATTAAATRS